MPTSPEQDISLLISRWRQGERDAEHLLFDALYQKLRLIAAKCLSDRRAQTLSPTGLVHEAYLRLVNSKELKISDSQHFLSLAARVMRRIVVDRARAIRAEKRGGAPVRVDLLEGMALTLEDADEILEVDKAMEQLALRYPREASLVELRFFAGFSLLEAASALGVCGRTARRDWEQARIHLKDAMAGRAAVTAEKPMIAE